MKDDPIHIPGQGCGCRRCREPLPLATPMSPEEAERRQAVAAKKRRDFQIHNGIYLGALGRGGKSA